jgi:hypothetical protein
VRLDDEFVGRPHLSIYAGFADVAFLFIADTDDVVGNDDVVRATLRFRFS